MGVVRIRWSGRDEPAPVDALPRELPEGQVTRMVGGGPFGWIMDARVDRVDGRVALEVLENSRMAGLDHYRVWEDGTKEELPVEFVATWPAGASEAEIAAARHRYDERNAAVVREMRERGFVV